MSYNRERNLAGPAAAIELHVLVWLTSSAYATFDIICHVAVADDCQQQWRIQVWAPPLTKTRGWSWLREAVCLGWGELSFKSLTFGPFCMKMDKELSAFSAGGGGKAAALFSVSVWLQ